jgi:hypothetical protein
MRGRKRRAGRADPVDTVARWPADRSGTIGAVGVTAVPANTGSKQGGRFQKGRAGNPASKPKGARHRTTLVAEAPFDGEAEALTRNAIELALAGDGTALRLCIYRILPPRRERPVCFKLATMQSAAYAANTMAAIATAVADANITLGEAAEMAKIIEAFVRAIEASEFDQRLRAIEGRNGATRP